MLGVGWWVLPGQGVVAYITLTVCLATFLIWYIKRRPMVSLINKLPGPTGVPLLGNSLQVTVDNRELFHLISRFTSYGEVIKVWLFMLPLVMVSSPKAVEGVLGSSRHIEKSHDYTFLYPWLGTGLLTSSGSKWHSRRKLLTPAFHFKILESFLDIFDRQGLRLVQKLRERADGSLFNILQPIALCTLDIICETAMGHTVNAQDQEDSEYVKAVNKINHLMQRRMTVKWQQPDFMYRILGYAKQRDECLAVLHRFTRDTIMARRRRYNEKKEVESGGTLEEEAVKGKKKPQLAFLDLLLEASDGGKVLSDEDIREEVDTFMFEGHDTTAAAISWSLYLLGRHPEIQALVHHELDTIFGDSERAVTMADLREMKYTENCIKEALRLFPSVPYLGRVIKEDLDICGFRIPAETSIMVAIYQLHRNPDQFPDPEKYDPDRFLPENASKRHPYAFIPFSAGPRNCIGQKFALLEEKAVVSRVLRAYRVVSDTPQSDLQPVGELILRPWGGNQVRLYPRHE